MLLRDPEDEGPVYSEEIVIVSRQSALDLAPFLKATRASGIAPLGENDRRKLGLAANEPAWLVSWN